MSVKANLQDMEENVREITSDLAQHSKEAKSLRCDYGIFEHTIAEHFKNDLTDLMRELNRMSFQFKKAATEDCAETVPLKEQVKGLMKEKILLQEHVLNLATKVASIEDTIGCNRNTEAKDLIMASPDEEGGNEEKIHMNLLNEKHIYDY